MFTNQSTDLSLDAHCRAVDSVKSTEENLWIAGTCNRPSHSNNNSLAVIRFHGDLNELELDQTFEMDSAIASVCCSPSDPSLVIMAPEHRSAATLWKLPLTNSTAADAAAAADGSSSLEEIASLLPDGGFGDIVDIAWRSESDGGGSNIGSSTSTTAKDVLTLDMNGHLTCWDVSGAQPKCVRSVDTVIDNDHHAPHLLPPPRTAWDPHANGDAVAVTHGNTVSILDWRSDTNVPTGTVETLRCTSSSSVGVCDLDYNPNKPYVLATAGQDGNIKFWDLRQAKRPLLTARGHSHWCQTVHYNPFHDQLVLSTGTDCITNLWRLSTVSSAPLLHEKNQRVSRTEGNDSVYAAAWGAADAWIYLTVCYDGKVVLNHVPSKEKYKILL